MIKPVLKILNHRFLRFTTAAVVWMVSVIYLPQVYGQNADDLVFKAADYQYKGELTKAIAMFEKAVALDPQNEYALNQLGVLYARKERYKDAFAKFSKVYRVDKMNTFAQLWLGILYLNDGNLDAAFGHFKQIIAIDPTHAEAYYFLGAIYNFRHNPAMAIKYLKKARDADSDEPDTHFRLARAFHSVDMIANAKLEYQRALDINPKYTKAINELGWIAYNKNDVDAAIAYWHKTLKINNRDRDAVLNLAKAYNELAYKALEKGDRKEAVSYWRKTLSVNPGNKAAIYYLKKNG